MKSDTFYEINVRNNSIKKSLVLQNWYDVMISVAVFSDLSLSLCYTCKSFVKFEQIHFSY